MENDAKVIRIKEPRSWKKILLMGFLILGLILSVSLGALNLIFPPRDESVSSTTLKIPSVIRSYIDGVVKKDANIVGVQIVTVNFTRNIRTETYMSIDSIALQEIYNRFVNNKIVETPVFSEDKVNNDRILRLINGDFVCVPYKLATAYKYAPQGESFVQTVCAIAIPPNHFGEFAGILSIYLNNSPSPVEIETLFLFSRDLSIKVAQSNNKYEANQ